MSRITMCLEGNTEGKVLASFDLDKFANKVRADAIDELSDLIDRLLWDYDMETYKDLSESFKESARLLKEQKNEYSNMDNSNS